MGLRFRSIFCVGFLNERLEIVKLFKGKGKGEREGGVKTL